MNRKDTQNKNQSEPIYLESKDEVLNHLKKMLDEKRLGVELSPFQIKQEINGYEVLMGIDSEELKNNPIYYKGKEIRFKDEFIEMLKDTENVEEYTLAQMNFIQNNIFDDKILKDNEEGISYSFNLSNEELNSKEFLEYIFKLNETPEGKRYLKQCKFEILEDDILWDNLDNNDKNGTMKQVLSLLNEVSTILLDDIEIDSLHRVEVIERQLKTSPQVIRNDNNEIINKIDPLTNEEVIIDRSKNHSIKMDKELTKSFLYHMKFNLKYVSDKMSKTEKNELEHDFNMAKHDFIRNTSKKIFSLMPKDFKKEDVFNLSSREIMALRETPGLNTISIINSYKISAFHNNIVEIMESHNGEIVTNDPFQRQIDIEKFLSENKGIVLDEIEKSENNNYKEEFQKFVNNESDLENPIMQELEKKSINLDDKIEEIVKILNKFDNTKVVIEFIQTEEEFKNFKKYLTHLEVSKDITDRFVGQGDFTVNKNDNYIFLNTNSKNQNELSKKDQSTIEDMNKIESEGKPDNSYSINSNKTKGILDKYKTEKIENNIENNIDNVIKDKENEKVIVTQLRRNQ